MAAVGALGLLVAGCTDSGTAPDVTEAPTALRAVVPEGGAVGVDPGAPVVVGFDHPMMPGMEDFAILHEGDVTGPEVPGTWTMSSDLLTLTFAPATPLAPATEYTIHIAGGMMDAEGNHVDLETHGGQMGGEWATEGMMGGGMMGGGTMGGAMGGDHMGSGWQHPTNDTFGMVFSFTTGA